MKEEVAVALSQIKRMSLPGEFALQKNFKSDKLEVKIKIDSAKWIGLDVSVKHPNGTWLGYSVDTDNYYIAKTKKDIDVSNSILHEIVDVLSLLTSSKFILGTYKSYPALYIPTKPPYIEYKRRFFFTSHTVGQDDMSNFLPLDEVSLS